MNKFKWLVEDAVPREDYTILIKFHDGKEGIYDAKHILTWPAFEPLKNKATFMQAHADNGTVVWNDELDIAPETLYAESTPVTR